MISPRWGFHEGPTGRGVPKYFFEKLNAAGVPFFAKRTDSLQLDAQTIARNNPSIDNIVMFRRSVGKEGTHVYDVPDYTLSAQDAAEKHWMLHYKEFPAELDPTITWVETVNEVNKNKSAWLGDFALATADIAKFYGYKWAAFGWSTGEPEIEHWTLPSVLAFLRLAYQNPRRLGIAIHEYSLSSTNIWNKTAADGSHWLVGRIEHIAKVCRDNGFDLPNTFVSEWGWNYNSAPPTAAAMLDFDSVGKFYAKYPNYKGGATWALNEGWGGIGDQVIQYVDQVMTYNINTKYPGSEPPPPPQKTLNEALWAEASSKQCISLNKKAALQAKMMADGFGPVGSESRVTYGNVQYAVQIAETWSGSLPPRTYVAQVPNWSNVWYINKPVEPVPPPPSNTVDMSIYFLPVGDYGDMYTLSNNWGQGPERTQLQRVGSTSYVVKNQQYEQRVVSPTVIRLVLDTSPGGGKYYTVNSPTGWIPSAWAVGATFTRSETVAFFTKSNCLPTGEGYVSTSSIKFNALHATWTSKGNIVLKNVVEMSWIVAGVVDETYFYAPRLGLVAWKKYNGNQSWISELIPLGTQTNNKRETGCFTSAA